MFKYAAIIAVSIGIAAPATAGEYTARDLGVEPGTYTLSEMVELMNVGGGERKRRIELIHKRRDDFAAAVRDAMVGADRGTPQVTRNRR